MQNYLHSEMLQSTLRDVSESRCMKAEKWLQLLLDGLLCNKSCDHVFRMDTFETNLFSLSTKECLGMELHCCTFVKQTGILQIR